MRARITPFAVAVVALAGCAPPAFSPELEAYQYERVAEVTNRGPAALDVYATGQASLLSMLGTVRPGESVRVTLPAGSRGVRCVSPGGEGAPDTGGRCDVRYLEPGASAPHAR